jgi:hypothetical protein
VRCNAPFLCIVEHCSKHLHAQLLLLHCLLSMVESALGEGANHCCWQLHLVPDNVLPSPVSSITRSH